MAQLRGKKAGLTDQQALAVAYEVVSRLEAYQEELAKRGEESGG